MKRILAILFFALSIGTVGAKETVTIVYSWTASDTAANYDRTLVDEANRLQDKYTFLFDARPGAGGSVAAHAVLSNPNMILSTSSAFFIRPNVYPNESYKIDQFQELMNQCDARFVIVSARYRSWQQVPTDRPLNIGISGMGTTTHLVASQIVNKYPKLQVIPFKSTSEALAATLAGTVDFSVSFAADTRPYKELHVLGITGPDSVDGYASLVSQGFDANLVSAISPYHLVVSANVPDEKVQEWRRILKKAAQSPSVLNSYAQQNCRMATTPDSQLQAWFSAQTVKWERLTQKLNIQK